MHGNAAVPCRPMRLHVVVGTNALVAWFKDRKAQLTNLGCLLLYPDLACCRQIQPQHKSPQGNGIPAKFLLIVTTRMILQQTGASNTCIALVKLKTSNYFKFQTHRWHAKSICTGEREQIAPQSWINVFHAEEPLTLKEVDLHCLKDTHVVKLERCFNSLKQQENNQPEHGLSIFFDTLSPQIPSIHFV